MRAQFVASEIAIGLRRNLTMTIAVVIVVAMSLYLVGSTMLFRKQVGAMKGFWYDKVEVSIFLKEEITAEQEQQLRVDLEALPEVDTVFFESKAEAYERFKEQFKESPAIVSNVTADALPKSFRVKLVDAEKFDVVATAFAARPGVDNVVNQRDLLQKFFQMLNGAQRSALFLAALALFAAVLMIGNTIRVAAFSRRRETGIMRLVGASNFFIQLPFLLEGALAGLLGALLAIGMLVATKVGYVDSLREAFTFTPFIGWGALWSVAPLLILLGVVLSAGSAFVTLRKYLRV